MPRAGWQTCMGTLQTTWTCKMQWPHGRQQSKPPSSFLEQDEDPLESTLVAWGSRRTGLTLGSAKPTVRRLKTWLGARKGKPYRDIIVGGERPTCSHVNGVLVHGNHVDVSRRESH